jgi:monovalent cation:H+ antiporter-2, CPA2 family
MHDTALVSTIAISLVCAFIGGFVAHKLRLSPIVGYLLVGIVIGPHTPGLVADPELAQQLSEIGVILLMFGVGMHFSIKDLLSVRGIAIPGALLQITVATTFGALLALNWGWSPGAAIFFGLALSVASTVVLISKASTDGLRSAGWWSRTLLWFSPLSCFRPSRLFFRRPMARPVLISSY